MMSPMPALLASRQLVASAGTVGGRGAPCAVVQPVVALSLPVQSAPTGPIAREAFLQVATVSLHRPLDRPRVA